MSSTSAYVTVLLVLLAFNSAPTFAVGASDAGADAAEAIPPAQPARDLTVVQRIRADPALREEFNTQQSRISLSMWSNTQKMYKLISICIQIFNLDVFSNRQMNDSPHGSPIYKLEY